MKRRLPTASTSPRPTRWRSAKSNIGTAADELRREQHPGRDQSVRRAGAERTELGRTDARHGSGDHRGAAVEVGHHGAPFFIFRSALPVSSPKASTRTATATVERHDRQARLSRSTASASRRRRSATAKRELRPRREEHAVQPALTKSFGLAAACGSKRSARSSTCSTR